MRYFTAHSLYDITLYFNLVRVVAVSLVKSMLNQLYGCELAAVFYVSRSCITLTQCLLI